MRAMNYFSDFMYNNEAQNMLKNAFFGNLSLSMLINIMLVIKHVKDLSDVFTSLY